MILYGKQSLTYKLVSGLNILLLVAFAVIAVYPFYHVYLYAFNDGQDAYKAPIYLWPRMFTVNNLVIALQQKGIMHAFNVSVLRTVIGTVTSCLLTASLAYALTKKQIPGYGVISTYFFITFVFSGGFIAFFLTIRQIGLYDSFLVYIVPGLYNYWYMIIFRSFFQTIPASVEESAEIDGATYLTIFFKLILPLSKPVLAAIALFTAINHWNDWFAGTFFVKSTALIPLQTLLQRMITQMDMLQNIQSMGGNVANYMKGVTPSAVRLAVVVITVTPIILIYPFLQKYFIKGIMIGAIKG